jgi:two-component system cell cycle sensor histidine kinase/response regulator CckA
MEQVLMNLAVNARDAMPRGGQLILETANITLDQSEPLSTPLPPGSYVMLTVTDTGVGMDADTQARVFEPFFTTKEMGKGTGLGLSTVYGIVQQSNGQIQVESILGQGTTFRIYLPQIEPTAESALLPAAAVTSMMGQETILVVEDEVSVRLVTRRILELRGYTVLEAGNPRAALNLCQQYQGQVDLLITDVIMPDLSGPELAERLMVSYPDLKVLFVSGYTNDVLDEYGIFGRDIVLLEKPFTPDGLTRKVRETLDSS